MNEFRLVIPGEPGAWQRPGARVINGHARLFQKAKSRKYADIVRQVAAVQWAAQPLIGETWIVMDATFYKSVPASWSKKKRAAALAHEVRPIGKPDIDNYVKAVKDGLSGVVYIDDSLIVDSNSRKRYAEQPRVEIVLQWDGPAFVAVPEHPRPTARPTAMELELDAKPF